MATDETYFENGREYYKATDAPVWPGRNREHPSAKPGSQEHHDPLIETAYVKHLLARLDDLEIGTRPSGGEVTAARKDIEAFEALNIAGQLVQYVAGWAINHQIGLGAENLKFVPLQPSGTRLHPQYLLERSIVDSHLHEKTGGAYRLSDDGNAEAARKCLVNLLRANPGAMPSWLQYMTIKSLEALDYGEVQPMLAPLATGRKRDLTLLRLQLEALGMVAFRQKLGRLKKDAVADVAGVLNVGANTLLSWETRLRSEFGRLEVDRTISFAQNHASWINEARRRRLRGQEFDDDIEMHEADYNDEALMELGKKYKAALSD
jgi:hypothetical protein